MKKTLFITLAVIIAGGLILTVTGTQNPSKTDDAQTNISGTNHSGHAQVSPDDPNMLAVQKLTKVSSTLGIDKKLYEFGSINIYGGKVSTTFTLTNQGTEPLVLTRVTTSCMCTDAKIDDRIFGLHFNPWANITIPPNGTKTVTVTFDPLAHGDNATGPITRVIAFETNSSSTPLIEAKVNGNVVKP